jgi:tRNA G18 (ribose-2'-O)-methylase SpoU
MPLIAVDSIDDPRIWPYRDLAQRNLTRQSRRFIAEGEKVVERLLASSFEVESILCEPDYADRYATPLAAETPIYVASHELLMATLGFRFHRGIVACGRRQPRTDISQLLNDLQPRATIVVCPNVEDPTNLGSIIRSTAAFGCDAIVLGSKCADPFSRRVLRVSMGAALHLPILESSDLSADLHRLKLADFELVAAVLDSAVEPLSTARQTARLALMLGSEGHGLSAQWLAMAQRRVTIPMQLGIDSLNVATAAAVLLYHFCSVRSGAIATP